MQFCVQNCRAFGERPYEECGGVQGVIFGFCGFVRRHPKFMGKLPVFDVKKRHFFMIFLPVDNRNTPCFL
jgi:hypothetical protein